MQSVKALVDSGRLTEGIATLTQEVKTHPADGRLRVFLFELLCFQGDLDRATKQLDVLSTQTTKAGEEMTVQVYRGLLAAEGRRRDVFHGPALPKFVTPPPPHVEQHVILVKKLQTSASDAVALVGAAEESTEATAGDRSGKPFANLRDADDRLGSVLEVFHGTEYLWVPINQIASLEIVPPKKLRDLMWAQARLEVHGQPVGDVFVPALYVDSYRHADEQVRLGRLTEWTAIEERMVTGTGQRQFLVDDAEVGLFDLGRVSFATTAATGQAS
jgi:type VI secretion system protein ImpE